MLSAMNALGYSDPLLGVFIWLDFLGGGGHCLFIVLLVRVLLCSQAAFALQEQELQVSSGLTLVFRNLETLVAFRYTQANSIPEA